MKDGEENRPVMARIAGVIRAPKRRAKGPRSPYPRGQGGAHGADVEVAWDALPMARFDDRALERGLVISRSRRDNAAIAFDVLRTRLLRVCLEKGWRRVAVTSAGKGMGKSLVCANLAFALARNTETRSILLDLDLRIPGLSRLLAQDDAAGMPAVLRGEAIPAEGLRRVGPRTALGLTDGPARDSAELLQSAGARRALAAIETVYAPDLLLCDLPPLLANDDAMVLLPQVDAVLLVAAAGQSTAQEICDCEAMIDDACAFLGVVLNKCRDDPTDAYAYYY